MESDLFVTAPHFEQFMPRDLIVPNQKHWKAVTLSLGSPWYLFVYEVEYEGRKVHQTTLVAWEATLLEILEVIPKEDQRAVARLQMCRDPDARWEIGWIQNIWASTTEEANETGSLLLQMEGDPVLRDAHLHPVPPKPGREMLFSKSTCPTAV